MKRSYNIILIVLSALCYFVVPAEATSKTDSLRQSQFSLKTNLLYDVALFPSIEAEYRFAPHWSVNLEYSIAWWSRKADHKYYQLMQLSPEVRFWLNPDTFWKGHYFGAFAGAGCYDLENSADGYLGEFAIAGLSYGYMFPIGKSLSLEAGLGLGWLYTQYEEYIPFEGHYVYMQTVTTSYLGPVKAKLALVWHLGAKERKGGRK